MNYKKANNLSIVILILALVISLSLYSFDETNALFIVIAILSVSFSILGITIRIVFYRCPHCHNGLPLRSSVPDYCSKCGKKLKP